MFTLDLDPTDGLLYIPRFTSQDSSKIPAIIT